MPLPSNWVSFKHGEIILTWPPLLFLIAILLLSWIFCAIFLRKLAPERRRSLSAMYRNSLVHAALSSSLFLLYSVLSSPFMRLRILDEVAAVIGVIVFLHWSYFAIKLGRLCILVALFFSNMRVAFPLLFVNIATLLLAVVAGVVVATELFAVQVVPLLATSAVFSIVLGIALQDTLGNLFAGLALQLDKPYEIDHWVEIVNGPQKWVGKIYEITWRATVLIGFADELITIPNRMVGQSTVLNFTVSDKPFGRILVIRVPCTSDFEAIKTVMVKAAVESEGVMAAPAPFCAVAEITDSYAIMKLIYSIKDYANQLTICDRVHGRIMASLSSIGVSVAPPRIQLVGERADKVL